MKSPLSLIPDWVKSIDRILMRQRPQTGRDVLPVAIATVDEVQWVLLFAKAQQLFCLIPQEESLRKGNTLEIPYDHMIELAEAEGTCVNRKKARALSKGLLDPAWEPRTYVMVGPDKEGYSYGLKMAELVAWGQKQIAAIKEMTDAQASLQASGAGSPVDAGRTAAPAPDGDPGEASAPG